MLVLLACLCEAEERDCPWCRLTLRHEDDFAFLFQPLLDLYPWIGLRFHPWTGWEFHF